MMGFFSTTRDPQDPQQLQIAVHELGHAWAWKDSGLTIVAVYHSGDDGNCHVRYWDEQVFAFAVGCWAGFEAEDQWLRQHRLGHAKRSHSSHDIRLFRAAARELGGLSEGKARSLARKLVNRRWSHIQHTAPELVRTGRIHL
jgi:hypothetical protein